MANTVQNRHILRKIAIGIAAFFAIVIVGVVIFVNSPAFQSIVVNTANKKSGRQVELGEKIHIHWGWPITTLEAKGIKVSNFKQGSKPNMLTLDGLKVSIDWTHLLKGDVYLPELVLDKPVLLLEKDAKGNGNWNFTDNPGGAAVVSNLKPDDRGDVPGIGHLVIHQGKLEYKDDQQKTDLILDADTVRGQASENDNIHVSGKGSYQNHDFAINLTGGNVFQLKDQKDPYPVDAHFEAGKTKATLKGTMLDPVQFKGMDIQLDIAGDSAAELFTFIGMALPPTPPYHVKGQLTLKDQIWHFDNFSGSMGDSDLSGSLSWDKTKKRPLLTGDFVSKNLDFKDLGAFVGAPAVKGKDNVSDAEKQRAAENAASPYLIPDTPLDISRLSAMDAKVTFTGKKMISTLPLDDFFVKVDLDDRELKLDPIRFGTAQGDVSADMTVNARQNPVQIGGDFYFHRLALKPLFAALAQKFGTKNVSDGYIGGAAHLKGQGKSLRQMLGTSNGSIGIGMENGVISDLAVQLLGLDVAKAAGLYFGGDEPVRVRCLIGDFGVTNGTMQVRHFVVDTTSSKLVGDGHINLKNETMNMTLDANPKNPSPLSLNSPITVTGTMKKPDVNIPIAGIAARGVVATALAFVFPPAAIAAFIEPGLGKDSNCAKLIAATKTHMKPEQKAMLPPTKEPAPTKPPAPQKK